MTHVEEIRADIRAAIDKLFDRIESQNLPLPYSIDPDKDLGTIEVNWMLQDDLEGSRAVFLAYPIDGWAYARSSSMREPVLEWVSGPGRESIKVHLWPHPEALEARVQVR